MATTFADVKVEAPRVRVRFTALPKDMRRFHKMCAMVVRLLRTKNFTEWVYDVSSVKWSWSELNTLVRTVRVYVDTVLKPNRECLAASHGTLIVTSSPAMKRLVRMAIRLVKSGAPTKCVSASRVRALHAGEKDPVGACADAWFGSGDTDSSSGEEEEEGGDGKDGNTTIPTDGGGGETARLARAWHIVPGEEGDTENDDDA